MIEYEIWDEKHSQFIVGADEVGRGSVAGPIVAASTRVGFHHLEYFNDVKDSKKLTESKRNIICKRIKETDLQVEYSLLTNDDIDSKGINYCNKLVLQNVLSIYFETNDLIYVDYVKGLGSNIIPLTKGEDKSIAIALASIMAKVYRDSMMVKLSKEFPEYELEKNKGYGTKNHLEAIRKYGLQSFHRKTFLKNFI